MNARAFALAIWLSWTVCLGRADSAEARPPVVVAVFLIENRGAALSREDVAALTDYLGNQLGEGGFYRIIPREDILRQRLKDAQKESYKACYDQSCQIEIGRELAAEQTVSASISRIGKTCVVTAAMFDLKKAATVKTATGTCPCKTDAFLNAIEGIAGKLRGSSSAPAEVVAPPPPSGTPKAERVLPGPFKPSPTIFRFVTQEKDRTFKAFVVAANGRSYSCEEVRVGEPCVLDGFVQGEARLMVRSPELHSYNDSIDIENKREVWIYTLEKRANAGSVISWTFGGLCLATGAALIPVGAGIDNDGMIWGGVASAAVGGGLLALGFFIDGNVFAVEDELEFTTGRDAGSSSTFALVPSPGGASVLGRF